MKRSPEEIEALIAQAKKRPGGGLSEELLRKLLEDEGPSMGEQMEQMPGLIPDIPTPLENLEESKKKLLDSTSKIWEMNVTDPNRPPSKGPSLSEMKANAAERAANEKNNMNRLIKNGFRGLVILFLALISMQLHPIARKAKTDFACTFFINLSSQGFNSDRALKRVQREGGLQRQAAISYCLNRG